jgi:hypothetical protein
VWTWAAASRRGSSHEKSNTRLQDAFSCFVTGENDEFFVGIVSDGAGSARFGGEGASLVCRTIGSRIRRHMRAEGRLPADDEILTWTDEVRDLLASVAQRREAELRDFASTLVCLIAGQDNFVALHVGDGCVVIRESGSDNWSAASWPEHGEYASTTYFMTDDSGLRLRISRGDKPIEAASLFSDGLERLALDFATKLPFPRFFNGVMAPVVASESVGRDGPLSAALKEYLGSPSVLARTDDDTTLILALRQ